MTKIPPVNIEVFPNDVWGYFKDHNIDLVYKGKIIAENPEYGCRIELKSLFGRPCVKVLIDDDFVVEDVIFNDAAECANTVQEMYDSYLTDEILKIFSGDDVADSDSNSTNNDREDSLERPMQEIEDRETDIDDAVEDLINVILEKSQNYSSGKFKDIRDDVKEHILQYLYLKYGLDIHRPMFLVFEGEKEGEEIKEFREYPYPDLELEDADNPIYEAVK